MRVCIVDHKFDGDDPAKCPWGFLTKLFSECSPEIAFVGKPPETHAAYFDTEAIFFVHVSGPEQAWRNKADTSKCHFVLLRSDGRQYEKANLQGNLHGCHWSAHEFKDPSNARVQKFVDQVRAGNIIAVDWELLRPDPVEPILAARLIVEAKAYEGKTLHGLQIQSIPADLFCMAKAVAEADTTDTASLLSAIEKFETALNR